MKAESSAALLTVAIVGFLACFSSPLAKHHLPSLPKAETQKPVFPSKCPKASGLPEFSDKQALAVTHVADGDTFSGCLLLKQPVFVKIRVQGIDCPETYFNQKCKRDEEQGRPNCNEQIPHGKKAKKRASELLHHQIVYLEAPKKNGRFRLDIYGRILAYVRLPDNRDFGLVMIEEKMCEDFSFKYPHPRKNKYQSALKGQKNRT